MSFFHPGSLKLTWMVAVVGKCFVLVLLHGCAGFSDTFSDTHRHTGAHTCADSISRYLTKISSLAELSDWWTSVRGPTVRQLAERSVQRNKQIYIMPDVSFPQNKFIHYKRTSSSLETSKPVKAVFADTGLCSAQFGNCSLITTL